MVWVYTDRLPKRQRASSRVLHQYLKVDYFNSNPGWSTIGRLLWLTIWNQPKDHGFFCGPDSLLHANMRKALKGTNDSTAKRRKALKVLYSTVVPMTD